VKLSLAKKFGCIQCRGGEVLRVATEHAVSGQGLGEQPHARTDLPAWVFAKPGDLAVELVAVKTGKVLGHTYLSGNAIQVNRYTNAQEGWFEPCKARLVELPTIEKLKPKSVKEFQDAMLATVVEMKYADYDLQGFEFRCARVEEPEQVANFILECARYKPEGEERAVRAEVLGMVTKGRGKRKKAVVLHFQRPDSAQDNAASAFQASLLVSALKRRNDK
jgi:hypothetical protein